MKPFCQMNNEELTAWATARLTALMHRRGIAPTNDEIALVCADFRRMVDMYRAAVLATMPTEGGMQ